MLIIGAETTRLSFGAESIPPEVLTLQTGDQRLVREQFGGTFPRALHLENAITVVEDELMRVKRPPARFRRLALIDRVLHKLVLAPGMATSAHIELDLDAVERLFDRLAAMSQGSPASHQGLPDDALLAARLVILRELMHHWHFVSVTVTGVSAQPGRIQP